MNMKTKFFSALMLVAMAVGSVFASDYKDGIEYFKANQPANAKTILERTINDATTNKAEAYYYLGEIAFLDKDYATAAKYYAQGLEADPANMYNRVGQGKLEMLKDPKSAEKIFKEALKGAKKDAGLNLAVAKAYYDTAVPGYEKYLENARKANKKFPEIYVFEGDVLAAQGRNGDACGYYEMAINFDPNCVEAYVKYSHMYFDINPQMAIGKLEELLAKAPDSALAQRELAEAYYKDAQYTKAATAYESYVANPNHFEEDRARLAMLLFYGKRYDESYKLAENILANDPNNFILNRVVIYNLYEMGRYEDAKKVAGKFFSLPLGKQTYLSRDFECYGDILMKLKESEAAAKSYIKAYEIDNSKKDLLKSISGAYEAAEKFPVSIDYYSQYMDAAGDDLRVMDYFRFGQTCYRVGMADSINGQAYLLKADSLFATVAEKTPDNYLGYMWRARAAAGRDPETTLGTAKPYYEQTIAILDQNAPEPTKAQIAAYIESYRYLGYYNFLKAYSEPAKAKEYKDNTRLYWNKMLEYDPNNTDIQEALKSL